MIMSNSNKYPEQTSNIFVITSIPFCVGPPLCDTLPIPYLPHICFLIKAGLIHQLYCFSL